ncbi:MAG: HSP20 family protein, partial [Planctomycetota bacterium]
ELEEALTEHESDGQSVINLHRDMNHLFNRFFGSEGPLHAQSEASKSVLDKWFGDFSPKTFIPLIDIADEPKHFKVIADMPGIESEDIELDVHDHRLYIKGEKRLQESTEESDGYYRTERAYGRFERVIPLPSKVDADHAEAVFKNGVLRVRIPKADSPKEERTTIKVNAV